MVIFYQAMSHFAKYIVALLTKKQSQKGLSEKKDKNYSKKKSHISITFASVKFNNLKISKKIQQSGSDTSFLPVLFYFSNLFSYLFGKHNYF